MQVEFKGGAGRYPVMNNQIYDHTVANDLNENDKILPKIVENPDENSSIFSSLIERNMFEIDFDNDYPTNSYSQTGIQLCSEDRITLQ